jgi:hypothetical protein
MSARILAFSLVACSHTRQARVVSLQEEQQRFAASIREQCAVVTGLRHETCLRLGPPRAPERDAWETASWWLYESRHSEMVPGHVEEFGPQVVCASYVSFAEDHVAESDQQCHRVKSYEP